MILDKIPKYLQHTLQLHRYGKCIEHKYEYVTNDNKIKIPNDDITYPLTYGIDQYKRPYICLRLYHTLSKTFEIHILYQKFSNYTYPWNVYETRCFFGQILYEGTGNLISIYVENKLEAIGEDNNYKNEVQLLQ